MKFKCTYRQKIFSKSISKSFYHKIFYLYEKICELDYFIALLTHFFTNPTFFDLKGTELWFLAITNVKIFRILYPKLSIIKFVIAPQELVKLNILLHFPRFLSFRQIDG